MELVRRLAAAERVCVMFGWAPAQDYSSDRVAALTELWMQWARIPGVDLSRTAHPELAAAEKPLAEQRRATRDAILRKLRGESA
jgi:hypothetical protein